MPGRLPDDSDPATADTSSPDPEPGSEHRKGPRQVRAGDTLGRYALGEELGEGGMATVFRARDRELRRDVAIKVLFPHLARRSDVVRRFHREARAAAGLEHPNILRIYDVGGAEGDDPTYIVMELIRGRTLLQEVEQRGAMLAEIAACIGALLGDALAAAHAAGIVHRDVKPANVLIAPGGRLLLADFGVARVETEDSLVTRTGALLGTPAYMSPEQAGGDVATAKSDVYSLGATLYQLATGTLPYSGAPAKVMSMIALGHLVAPVRRRPACGPDLSRLIERMMATDPSARPASATAIAAELRAHAAAGGLGDATEELAAYFEDPDGFLRTRTPTVVGALVTAANAAVNEARLPRAMALADRASALAPDDPTVTALVQAVTEGGQTSRRRRGLAIAGIAVAVAGGTTALGWQLRSPDDTGTGGSALDMSPMAMVQRMRDEVDAKMQRGLAELSAAADARAAADVAPVVDAGAGAPTAGDIALALDAALAVASAPGDARRRSAPDARASSAQVGPVAVPPSDAAPGLEAAAPVDAARVEAHAPPEAADAALETAPGYVIVRNDVWCNIWIDGVDRGNRRNERLEVTPGRHTVRCVNLDAEWRREIDVPPRTAVTVVGTLLGELDVTLAIDATIDGKPHRRGSVVKLKPGVVEVIVGGRKRFITFRSNCTLSDSPELGCYL